MDPNATLRELLEAILTQDANRATELAEALHRWLQRGGFSPMSSPPTGYRGWRNYSTWNVHRWLKSTQEIDCECLNRARDAIVVAPKCGQVREGTWRVEEAPRRLLVEQLKELVDARNPLRDESSLYADLLGSALHQIGWNELAEAFLERVSW